MEWRGGKVQWRCCIFNEAAIAILAQFASDLANGIENQRSQILIQSQSLPASVAQW
jgi:hypothetical protein